MNRSVKFFAGNNTQCLAEKIASCYGTKLSKASFVKFSDGEFEPSFDETGNEGLYFKLALILLII